MELEGIYNLHHTNNYSLRTMPALVFYNHGETIPHYHGSAPKKVRWSKQHTIVEVVGWSEAEDLLPNDKVIGNGPNGCYIVRYVLVRRERDMEDNIYDLIDAGGLCEVGLIDMGVQRSYKASRKSAEDLHIGVVV